MPLLKNHIHVVTVCSAQPQSFLSVRMRELVQVALPATLLWPRRPLCLPMPVFAILCRILPPPALLSRVVTCCSVHAQLHQHQKRGVASGLQKAISLLLHSP